jgi:hypothetical protein
MLKHSLDDLVVPLLLRVFGMPADLESPATTRPYRLDLVVLAVGFSVPNLQVPTRNARRNGSQRSRKKADERIPDVLKELA